MWVVRQENLWGNEMAEKKKVMIVAHFCDYGNEQSNNRFNYLADCFARNGMAVELVTSSFSHRDKTQRKEGALQEGYKTTLIYEPSYKRNISLKRLFISHATMAKNLRKYLENREKPDLIYCAIPSVDVSEVAAQYANDRGIPFVLDVQDLWPEAYRLVLGNGALYKTVESLLKKRVDRVYAAADQIVAVSDTYAQRAKSVNIKCAKPLTVYLGTDAAAFDAHVKESAPQYLKPQGEFWLGYCGTLGSSYDLTTVMEAMKVLLDRGIKNIRLVVMGSGPLEDAFRQKADTLGIPVTFTGKLPYGQMCAQLARCDAAVNPIAAGAAQSIINKHADYAVAGLAVINTQENAEYRQLLETYGCGISCEPADVQAVADAIERLNGDRELCARMGAQARQMGLERFDRAEIYHRLVKTMDAML